jgi:aspartate-semialdehyde dehydrogenase
VRGLRVGVVGASGALGSEVLAALEDAPLAISEIVPVATERSLGAEISFRGEDHPLLTGVPVLAALDLLVLCAPHAASLELAREALRARVPCIDASGVLAGAPGVAPRIAAFGAEDAGAAPLLAAPPGVVLPLALALRPLAQAAGLRRLLATLLEGASAGGRRGMESLYAGSLALLNQQDADALADAGDLPRVSPFDCAPAPGEDEGQAQERWAALLGSLLGAGALRAALERVRIPVFVGYGAVLAVETERALSAGEARERLAKSPGLELWPDAGGPSLRDAAGRDAVLVGRVREDPSVEHGLLLWLAADLLHLAARNAVQLAVARFARPH